MIEVEDPSGFIVGVYQRVLGREPKEAEVREVLAALQSRAISPLEWLQTVLESEELENSRNSKALSTSADFTIEHSFVHFHKQVEPYTMTGTSNLWAIYDSVRYLAANHIDGALVECGVWRGGSAMMMALSTMHFDQSVRSLHCYDTFVGMSEPSIHDVRYDGTEASLIWEPNPSGSGSNWHAAARSEVQANILSTGFPFDLLSLIPGPVEETLTQNSPDLISLLRLDTDWYESTRVELEILYPKLVSGGVLIIDDYAWWRGSRQAVDEYFGQSGQHPFLARIDPAGSRLLIKP